MKKDDPESVGSSEKIYIDYTDCLAALCNKRWRFMDAMYGVLPIFGMVTKRTQFQPVATKERLKMLALQVLSTQVSDETNIVRLITLAQQQGLTALDIQLPYPLTIEQLVTIGEECSDTMALSQQNERLSIHIESPAPPR